jgi:ABC-2 type transport system permease protein
MMHFIRNVWRLGVKELRSFFADPILLILVIYIFTIAVYSVATGAKTEVVNAAIAVVDEDHSPLSREIAAALLPPYFQQARQIDAEEAITGMNKNEFVFVIDIPPNFERDLLRGDKPSIQVSADATAMSLAGIGVNYVSSIISQEISTLLREHGVSSNQPINLVSRYLFNPNAESLRYTSVMQVINNVSMLAIILAGAALIRERERGTVEHLLVMPVSAAEIMVAKIWANGLVILIGALISLVLVVQTILGIPIAGSLGSCWPLSHPPCRNSPCWPYRCSSFSSFYRAARRRWRACRSGCRTSCSSRRRPISCLMRRRFSTAGQDFPSSGPNWS